MAPRHAIVGDVGPFLSTTTDIPTFLRVSNDKSEAACELLESGAAIIIVEEEYNHDLRETLQMAGAEAV
jgi:hypothetical protein